LAAFVALLRGINVGANKRMKMDALRQSFAGIGLNGAKTYLQSGNVIFPADGVDEAELAPRIEAAIEKSFGFHSHVILRGTAEMRRTVASNPFGERGNLDAAKLAVIFLRTPPSPAQRNTLLKIEPATEEIHVLHSELYIYYPDGMGKSKLTGGAIEKALGNIGTARNWRSVTNILALLEETEASHGSVER
jgi:uncharacterized protein (DUF1697 family)